jgi:TRAP-type C4-dicarboxylate transport system permease small subunit
MPLGPLGVTALLAALDWGAWDWAASNNHTTVGVIAGLLMAPIVVAFAWSLIRVLLVIARTAIRRATAVETRAAPAMGARTPQRPFDIEAHDDRIAA